MAPEEDVQLMQIDQNVEDDDSTSSSDDGGSGDEDTVAPVEWLATGREKRSTAGNRMKSMLAAEEPDDVLELLFAEDGDDAGFTDVEGDASDVQMDSSSDDEDAKENADDDEGEKELERQARERRQATRKRKAQEAIPVKFRKKVKISATVPSPSMAAPEPRPKKKSERTSWLPTNTDMPTRASKRETTMISKEQLHHQMIEREVKRLKQVAAMERKAKKAEALKKPPMTQAQRLAEAAVVEKRNAKSLNRWEEAEKIREEERRKKLAALNNRKLDGPVITFWSGVGEWIDGKLKHVGKIVTIEEKPVKKKKRGAGDGDEDAPDTLDKAEDGKEKDPKATDEPATTGAKDPKVTEEPATTGAKDTTPVTSSSPNVAEKTATTDATETSAVVPPTPKTTEVGPPGDAKISTEVASASQKSAEADTGAGAKASVETILSPPISAEEKGAKDAKDAKTATETASSKSAEGEVVVDVNTPSEVAPLPPKPTGGDKPTTTQTTVSNETTGSPALEAGGSKIETQLLEQKAAESKTPEPKPAETKAPQMKAPDFRSPSTSQYTTSMFAPPQQNQAIQPPGLKPPSNSFLAPPSGVHQSGLSMPVLGYSPTTNKSSNVLAPPNTAQRQSPLSMPQTNTTHPPPLPKPAPPPSRPSQTPPTAVQPQKSKPASKAQGTLKPTHGNASKKQATPAEAPPPPPPSPPPDGKATRNCIIMQNFEEDAIKEKAVQTHILFGKEMSKLGKQAPPPRCAITNHPARYKDPKTGLPYYNGYAFKEIQKLQRGDYKWSRLVGAWVGSGTSAARGVPARFLDPNAPAPEKKPVVVRETAPAGGGKSDLSTQAKTPATVPAAAVTGASRPPVATTPAKSVGPVAAALPATAVPKSAVPTFAAPRPTVPTFTAPKFAAPTSAVPTATAPRYTTPTSATPKSAAPTVPAPASAAPTSAAPTSAAPASTAAMSTAPTSAVSASVSSTTTSLTGTGPVLAKADASDVPATVGAATTIPPTNTTTANPAPVVT